MSKIRILHLADMHFERKIVHLNPEKAKIRRSETLITFKRAVERFNDAELVLISGDMFDGECSDSALDFVTSVFKQHSDKRFFISCGNHDCCESSAIKKLMSYRLQNVKIFGEVCESVYIEESKVYVHGISFSSESSYTSLLAGFKICDKDAVNIMVIHGDVSCDTKYNPISASDIESSCLDYLALGHVHKFSGFCTAGNTTYAYPGVLEPSGFDETGECGVIYGEISKDNVCLDFYPMSRRKYCCLDFDVSEYKSNEEIIGALTEVINKDDIYKINFCGSRNNFALDFESYKEIIDAFWLELYDLTENADSILNYLGEISLRGNTAKHLASLEYEYDLETYRMACEIITNLMC